VEAVQLQRTRQLKADLEGREKLPRVLAVLAVLDEVKMDLVLFLDAVLWGDSACSSDPKVRYQRTGLMRSKELPEILERCYEPPQKPDQRDARVVGGRKTLEDFAAHCMANVINRELKSVTRLMYTAHHDLSETTLTS
ncbi:hypothetical protein JAAARDRAFT_94623, partial [Jaapia argillacea MUCL 33604]